MIRGAVNARNEIRIDLRVLDGAGFHQIVDAILDTGFNGWLALPHAYLARSGMTQTPKEPRTK